jgi:hypothetical protein
LDPDPLGGLPVRAPFDFSGKRILHFPRAGSRVNEQRFRELLTRRIDTLLLQT